MALEPIRVVGSNKNEIEITAEIELQAPTEADLARLGMVTGFVLEEGISRTGIISIGTHNKLGDKKLWKKFPKNLLNLPFRIDYVVSVPHFTDLEIDGGIIRVRFLGYFSPGRAARGPGGPPPGGRLPSRWRAHRRDGAPWPGPRR